MQGKDNEMSRLQYNNTTIQRLDRLLDNMAEIRRNNREVTDIYFRRYGNVKLYVLFAFLRKPLDNAGLKASWWMGKHFCITTATYSKWLVVLHPHFQYNNWLIKIYGMYNTHMRMFCSITIAIANAI